MAWLWLAALLTPAACLRMDERRHSPDDLNPPIKNLRMDPSTKRLTWTLTGNVSHIECHKEPRFDAKAKRNRYCQFYVLDQCKASTYTVNGTIINGQPFSAWIQYPEQEGNPLAAATHLDCQVHDVHFLTCRWAVGREAPSDVQYYFYLEDVSTGKQWECPRYTANELRTHVQCQFGDLSDFPDVQYRFLVNGSSRNSRIPCSELISVLSRVEELVAPTITATCNKSLSVIEWKMASHFHRKFDYELEIQQGTDPPFFTSVRSEKSWMLPNPGTFTVRIRARVSDRVGQWSAPQHFVCDREEGERLDFWLTSSLTVLATLATMGPVVLLCKRYSVLKKVFPPIPHMKDPLGDHMPNEKMMAWEAGRPTQEDCPVAEMQVLKEM